MQNRFLTFIDLLRQMTSSTIEWAPGTRPTVVARPLFVLLIIGLVAVIPVSAQRRAIRGRVTDAAGVPAKGVSVELLKNGERVREVITADDGQFNLDVVDLSEGEFQVRIAANGIAPTTVALEAGTTQKTVTVGGLRAEVRALGLAMAAPSRPPPPPPPAATTPGAGPPTAAAPAPDETATSGDNHAIVPVFYATDRNRVAVAPLAYGGEREPTRQLHLGRIDVSVPRDHQPGLVERPTIWTFWREDPTKHFIIVRGIEQTYDEFYRQVRETVGKSEAKEVFVFVHGFNVTFESAVYRTAQIAYDLGFDGAPILYSWPSVGLPTGYPTDANNSEWTIDHLHWFLEDVARRSGARYIHVIAHSRGNWPLLRALNTIATEPRNDPRPQFRQIILTAPDVDADTFRLLAQHVRTLGERTTLYASANDEALSLSKRYQGYQRAGDVRPDIVIVPGLDSIDVSAVDTSFLGHSYYGSNTSVISDIARLLRTGLPPNRRCGLQPVAHAMASYWTFIAHAACPLFGGF